MKEYHYEINGKSFRVKVKEARPNRAVVVVNDVEYEVHISSPAVTQADVVTRPESEAMALAEPKPARLSPRPTSPANGLVRAPMPGVILKILVQVGDTLAAGDTVMIIEAMKMENEIRAPLAGRLLKLMVGEGDSVNTNDELFQMGT